MLDLGVDHTPWRNVAEIAQALQENRHVAVGIHLATGLVFVMSTKKPRHVLDQHHSRAVPRQVRQHVSRCFARNTSARLDRVSEIGTPCKQRRKVLATEASKKMSTAGTGTCALRTQQKAESPANSFAFLNMHSGRKFWQIHRRFQGTTSTANERRNLGIGK